VEVLVNGHRVAVREFGASEGQILMPSLRRHLPERVLDRARRIFPFAVVNRLIPLYLRLMTHAGTHGAPRFKEIVWRIDLPSGIVRRQEAQLTLAIDEPHTPLEVGWSLDQRPLGVHLRSFKLE
jgi:hypothetical protein